MFNLYSYWTNPKTKMIFKYEKIINNCKCFNKSKCSKCVFNMSMVDYIQFNY